MLPKSVIISPLDQSDMIEGRGGTFECVVDGGNPRPVVTWLLNHKRYTTVEYVSIKMKISKLHFIIPLLNIDPCNIKYTLGWLVGPTKIYIVHGIHETD